jgi:hypothetical protein
VSGRGTGCRSRTHAHLLPPHNHQPASQSAHTRDSPQGSARCKQAVVPAGPKGMCSRQHCCCCCWLRDGYNTQQVQQPIKCQPTTQLPTPHPAASGLRGPPKLAAAAAPTAGHATPNPEQEIISHKRLPRYMCPTAYAPAACMPLPSGSRRSRQQQQVAAQGQSTHQTPATAEGAWDQMPSTHMQPARRSSPATATASQQGTAQAQTPSTHMQAAPSSRPAYIP